MDSKSCYAALVLMLLASTPAAVRAQTVGELADVQAQTLLFKAQAARAEAARKLAEATADGGALIPGGVGADALPVVEGVFGSGTRLYATFLYSNGSTVDARQGELIPGGYSVRSIAVSGVVLGRRGKSYTVGFSDSRPITTPPPGKSQDQAASAAMGPIPVPGL